MIETRKEKLEAWKGRVKKRDQGPRVTLPRVSSRLLVPGPIRASDSPPHGGTVSKHRQVR